MRGLLLLFAAPRVEGKAKEFPAWNAVDDDPVIGRVVDDEAEALN